MSDELLPVVEHDNHTDQILKIKDLHGNQRSQYYAYMSNKLNCFVRNKHLF